MRPPFLPYRSIKSLMDPAWVILHWPPPDIKSFVPARPVFSRIRPVTAMSNLAPANRPAAPAPTIIQS